MRYCAHIENSVKWEESKHKRDKSGRFSKTGGGGTSASEESVPIGSTVDPNAKRRTEQRFYISKRAQEQIDKIRDTLTDKEKRSLEQNYEKMSRTQDPERALQKATLISRMLKRKGIDIEPKDLLEDRQGGAQPAPKPKPEPKPTPSPKPKPKSPLTPEQQAIEDNYKAVATKLGLTYKNRLHSAIEKYRQRVHSEYSYADEFLKQKLPEIPFTDKDFETINKYIAQRNKLDGNPSEFNNKAHLWAYKSKFDVSSFKAMHKEATVKTEEYLKKTYNKSDFDNLSSASSQFSDVYDKNLRLAPDSFAGVKRGKPMSISVADTNNANPGNESSFNGFKINCQTCVPTMELRCRGYDVVASKNTGKADCLNDYLSLHSMQVYLNPETGEPKYRVGKKYGINAEHESYTYVVSRYDDEAFKTSNKMIEAISKEFDQLPNGRYSLAFNCKSFGHTTMIIKDEYGARVVDPQFTDPSKYQTTLGEYLSYYTSSGINKVYGTRIDNTIINPMYESLFLPRHV